MTRTGSCQCGQVNYAVEGPELGLAICYCTECQKMSTGIGTYSLIVPRASFHIRSGWLKHWQRNADSGATITCHFCPECGVRIYHESSEMDLVRVKAGTLDNARELEPDVHVWTRSAPAWVKVPPGSLAYETQGNPAEMMAAVQARRGGLKQNTR